MATLTYRAVRHVALRLGADPGSLPDVTDPSLDWAADAIEVARTDAQRVSETLRRLEEATP